MKRSEFLRFCAAIGVGIPLRSSFASGTSTSPASSRNVIVIGAGAAGLTTAYWLKRHGIDSIILEASKQFGGRMKRTKTFADFPLPLGAEWIHTDPRILRDVIADPTVKINTKTVGYDPKQITAFHEGYEMSLEEAGFDTDYKFVNATWFDFFEQYILPSVKEQIRFGSVVTSIDYANAEAIVETEAEQFKADKVVVTIPVKMLQKGAINFSPELPRAKGEAIEKIRVWNGCKAFIEFKECFYPTFTSFEIDPESSGQKLYYDAAYGQDSTRNILGLFAVGTGADPYQTKEDDDSLIKFMLRELDAIFDGKASTNYVKHVFQDWNKEPFIEGAYLYDHESWLRARVLGKSVGDKLFFAGEAYSDGENWGGVDAAISSARRAVAAIAN